MHEGNRWNEGKEMKGWLQTEWIQTLIAPPITQQTIPLYTMCKGENDNCRPLQTKGV